MNFVLFYLFLRVVLGTVHILEHELHDSHTRPFGAKLQAIHPNVLSANVLSANGVKLNSLSPNAMSPNAMSPNAMSPNALSPNALEPNGINPNGINPNGINPNGINPNGIYPNGLELNGIYPNGLELNGLELNGLELNAFYANAFYANALFRNPFTVKALSGTSYAFLANTVSPNGDASQFPWASEVTFEKLNLARLVLKYASALNISDSDLTNVTTWSVVNVTLKELRGSELIGSLFAMVEGETYEIPLSGSDVTGMLWKYLVVRPDGTWDLSTLRVDQVSTDDSGDIHFYALSSFNWTSGEWNSVCEKNGTNTEAILLNNYWDPVNQSQLDFPHAVTIACRRYALAKCVEWGYKPWQNATYCISGSNSSSCQTVSLKDYHQACTRMCRADYCGNGQGWTADGTLIDIWDNLTPPIQARAEPSWHVEAEWNLEGAVCLSGTRLSKWEADGMQPQCANKPDLRNAQLNCGAELGSSMFGTSYPPQKATTTDNDNGKENTNTTWSIVVPSVVIPIAVILLATIVACVYRKRRFITIKPQANKENQEKQEKSTSQVTSVTEHEKSTSQATSNNPADSV